MIVVWLFLVVPSLCLQFVSVVFPDCTHFLFFANPRIIFKALPDKIDSKRHLPSILDICYYICQKLTEID